MSPDRIWSGRKYISTLTQPPNEPLDDDTSNTPPGDDARAPGYDALADHEDREGWESPWGDNPLQEFYAWPATRSMLPDLDGTRVLDAGCGVGDHVEWLREQGASVVGVDASEQALQAAHERFGNRASFAYADLTGPLAFDDGVFDTVLAHLVLDHVAELSPSFAEFVRVLAGSGHLVFTTVHPMQYYLAYAEVDSYYERQSVEVGWDAPVTSYHRPLGDILDALVGAGFRIEAVEEPRPQEAYVERAAAEWEVDERPQILCVRARVPP